MALARVPNRARTHSGVVDKVVFAIAGVVLLLAASVNLVVEARTALRSNDLEVQFFFELERLRGEPVNDASAGHHHGLPTDPASRHAEPDRDRGDTLDRSVQGK